MFQQLQFSTAIFLVAIIFASYSFVSVHVKVALSAEDTYEEAKKGEERSGGSPDFAEEMKKTLDEEETKKILEKKINKARGSLEINQRRLRIVRNIVTSTVAQLQLERTEITELRGNSKIFEKKLSELEILYKDYLNNLVVFSNGKGPNPGDIKEVFDNARIKKEQLRDFYDNTLRGDFEEALRRNEEWKAEEADK